MSRVKVFRDKEHPWYVSYTDSKSPRPDKIWWIGVDTYQRLTSMDDELRFEGIERLIHEILENWEHDHEVVQRGSEGPINPKGVTSPIWPEESRVKHYNCGNRFSHGPHYRETDGAYCTGRSYDQT